MDPVGKTVYLLGCLAENTDLKGAPCSLIGLFDVEEYVPFEPANYCWSPGYLVVAVGEDNTWFFVGAQDLCEQVAPAIHADNLMREREMDFAEEDMYVL